MSPTVTSETLRRIYGELHNLREPQSKEERWALEIEKIEANRRKQASWNHRDGVITNFIFLGIPLFILCYYWALYFIVDDLSPLKVLGCCAEMFLIYILLADGERI